MTNWNRMGEFSDCYNPSEAETRYIRTLVCSTQHTKGSYTEVVSSLPYDISGIIASSLCEYYGSYPFLWDIAIGAASSESVIVSNLGHKMTSTHWFAGINHFIPLSIKSGSRISARAQSTYTTSAQYLRVAIHFLRKSFNHRGFQICDTYGDVPASSIGTSIDPGGTVNTKGSWVELTSGLTRSINGFWLYFSNLNDYTRTNDSYWATDIGVGSSGNEVSVLKDFVCSLWSGSALIMPHNTPLLNISIPAGTRISARTKCTINTVGARELGLIMYTVS